MENYIPKLQDEEIELLGCKIANSKALKLVEAKRERLGSCMAEYKTTKHYTTNLNVLDKSKIFKLNLSISDFEVTGCINSLITIEKQKTLDRFVSFMVKKFGREYATKCYYYHKNNTALLIKNTEEFIKTEFANNPTRCVKEIEALKKDAKIFLNHLKYVLNIALINNNENELAF